MGKASTPTVEPIANVNETQRVGRENPSVGESKHPEMKKKDKVDNCETMTNAIVSEGNRHDWQVVKKHKRREKRANRDQ